VLVKLKCWESVINLLDGICEMAVQLSVHTVYRYGGYCCVCHGENIETGRLILLVYPMKSISPLCCNGTFLKIMVR
jgi:hypothetical protein